MNKKISWFFTFILVIFTLYNLIPRVQKNFLLEGQKISSLELKIIENDESYQLKTSNTLIIFWASWCAPCKVEMKKISLQNEYFNKNSVELLAINPFEDKETQKLFINKNKNLPFLFLDDEGILTSLFKIDSTPSMIRIKQGFVTKVTSGISILPY